MTEGVYAYPAPHVPALCLFLIPPVLLMNDVLIILTSRFLCVCRINIGKEEDFYSGVVGGFRRYAEKYPA